MFAICYSVIFVDVLGEIIYEETAYHPDGKANEHLLDRLLSLEYWLVQKARQYVTMEWISPKRKKEILKKSTACHHCGIAFEEDEYRVWDHDHYTGAFIGIAHNEW